MWFEYVANLRESLILSLFENNMVNNNMHKLIMTKPIDIHDNANIY